MDPQEVLLQEISQSIDKLIFVGQVAAWGIGFIAGLYSWRFVILCKNQSSIF